MNPPASSLYWKQTVKQRKGLPSSHFWSKCAAVIEGWPGGQPGWLFEVKLRSCRRGIKLKKSTCLAERSRTETGGRFPYGKPKRKQWIQRSDELDWANVRGKCAASLWTTNCSQCMLKSQRMTVEFQKWFFPPRRVETQTLLCCLILISNDHSTAIIHSCYLLMAKDSLEAALLPLPSQQAISSLSPDSTPASSPPH